MPVRFRTPSGIRKALAESTNFGDRSSNLPYDESVISMPKMAGGKSPLTSVFYELDSSESIPSSHDSIINAQKCSKLGQSLEARLSDTIVTTGGASFEMLSLTADGTETAVPTMDVYHPTSLTTIAEQKSLATLRNCANLTVRQKASVISHLSRQASAGTLRAKASARRRHAFSVSDSAVFRVSKNILKKWTSSTEASVLSIPIVPLPSQPVHSPPRRASTPQGLPTFNTTAATSYRLPAPEMRFRDLFRFGPSPAEQEWYNQTFNLPRDAVMRGEDGIIVKGRWRPGQSGHTGQSSQQRHRRADGRPFEPSSAHSQSHAETICESVPNEGNRSRNLFARSYVTSCGASEGLNFFAPLQSQEQKPKGTDSKIHEFLRYCCTCGEKAGENGPQQIIMRRDAPVV